MDGIGCRRGLLATCHTSEWLYDMSWTSDTVHDHATRFRRPVLTFYQGSCFKVIQSNDHTTAAASGMYTAAIRGTNSVFLPVKSSYKQSEDLYFSAITRDSALAFTSHTNTHGHAPFFHVPFSNPNNSYSGRKAFKLEVVASPRLPPPPLLFLHSPCASSSRNDPNFYADQMPDCAFQ